MRDRVRPAWPGATLAAPAYPVRCGTGDNLAVHVAVARAPEGSALVVDVGELRELGYWGEVLTTAAQSQWQAAAWKRERITPERWGRLDRAKLEVTGKAGGPVEVVVSSWEQLVDAAGKDDDGGER